MENKIHELPESIQRVAMITHIHELAAKSGRCHIMLREVYNRMLVYASEHGIQVSTILPDDSREGVEGSA
mgnify:CR=1 FL=1